MEVGSGSMSKKGRQVVVLQKRSTDGFKKGRQLFVVANMAPLGLGTPLHGHFQVRASSRGKKPQQYNKSFQAQTLIIFSSLVDASRAWLVHI
jgi:hypothetical protein